LHRRRREGRKREEEARGGRRRDGATESRKRSAAMGRDGGMLERRALGPMVSLIVPTIFLTKQCANLVFVVLRIISGSSRRMDFGLANNYRERIGPGFLRNTTNCKSL